MASTTVIIITVIILLLIVVGIIAGFYFAIRFLLRSIKKKKQLKTEIPPEVLDDFNRAEEMLKESRGTMSPQEILWELQKNRNTFDITKEYPRYVPEPEQQPEVKKINKVNRLSKFLKKK